MGTNFKRGNTTPKNLQPGEPFFSKSNEGTLYIGANNQSDGIINLGNTGSINTAIKDFNSTVVLDIGTSETTLFTYQLIDTDMNYSNGIISGFNTREIEITIIINEGALHKWKLTLRNADSDGIHYVGDTLKVDSLSGTTASINGLLTINSEESATTELQIAGNLISINSNLGVFINDNSELYLFCTLNSNGSFSAMPVNIAVVERDLGDPNGYYELQ